MKNKITLISILLFIASTLCFSQSTQGYSLDIQKVFPNKSKSEIIAKNEKTLNNINNIIAKERAKRKNDNWVMTVKGPGNYNATPIIQNINYIISNNSEISYLKNESDIIKLKTKTNSNITKIIISECSVYGTIKKSDTLNYDLNFKYFENNDTVKIGENNQAQYSSPYFCNMEEINIEINKYKQKLNDNTKNRLIRSYKNNKQILAYSNYEEYLKSLENKKKFELEKITQKNKELEQQRIKLQKKQEEENFFEKLDLIECSKFNKLQQSVQGLMNDKSIKNLNMIKQQFINSNDSIRKELNRIVDNLLPKDDKKK